ncbi:MAG: hypothetical protein ACI9XZ_003713 [Alphaproteobacteria bacterium]|jgi:hypothetical protein
MTDVVLMTRYHIQKDRIEIRCGLYLVATLTSFATTSMKKSGSTQLGSVWSLLFWNSDNRLSRSNR